LHSIEKYGASLDLRPCRDAASKSPSVRRPEDRSQLQASGIWFNAPMSAPKQGLSPCALIKEKVYSLKEKRADEVRREVAWNQERNIGFGWESAVRAVS
jgi:hypothetical protein